MNATSYINQSEYEPRFWNMARCRSGQDGRLSTGYNTINGTYTLPAAFGKKLEQELSQESLFRGMATVIRAYGNDYTLYAKDTDDLAQFVEEGGLIPVYNGIDDFTVSKIGSHKLAVFVKLDEDFVNDAGFSIEDYLAARLGRNFGRAEDNGFINGSGLHEPTGILHADAGAEIGVTAGTLTYDDVIGLYFSVRPEYRRNGVWLMNDKTALALRTLKDADGNYLYRKIKGGCSSHQIRNEVLERLLLDGIQTVTAYAREHEADFVELITQKSQTELDKSLRDGKRELEQAQARIRKLDDIIQRLYEDNLEGKVSDERFARMTANYEEEQKGLESRVAELKKLLAAEKDRSVNVDHFLALVRKYTDVQELTAEIVREFVEKVYVYQAERIDGQKVQRIRIVWNCIGEFTPPTVTNTEKSA